MIKVEKEAAIIKPHNIKPSSNNFKVLGAINPAAIRLPNGDILLYIRIIEMLKKTEDAEHYFSPRFVGKDEFEIKIDKFKKKNVVLNGKMDLLFKDGTKRLKFISHLRIVVLDKSGFKVKSIDKKPSFYGIASDGELGIEDPRITKIGNKYIMTYVSLSRKGGVSTSYAISKDAIKWQRKGIIFREQNKDVVLFPEKIKGRYFAYHRPEGNFEFMPPHIWISSSKDLDHWGNEKQIILSTGKEWDAGRVGAGPPPIKTDHGWLFIYHGVIEGKVKGKNAFAKALQAITGQLPGTVYCAGAVLMDIHKPEKILARGQHPIILPRRKHEKGTFENKRVVFPTGIVHDDENHILLYSGGGDVVTTVRRIDLRRILKFLKSVDN